MSVDWYATMGALANDREPYAFLGARTDAAFAGDEGRAVCLHGPNDIPKGNMVNELISPTGCVTAERLVERGTNPLVRVDT